MSIRAATPCPSNTAWQLHGDGELTFELLWGQGDRDLATEVMSAGAIGLLVGGVLIGSDFRLLGSHLVSGSTVKS